MFWEIQAKLSWVHVRTLKTEDRHDANFVVAVAPEVVMTGADEVGTMTIAQIGVNFFPKWIEKISWQYDMSP